MKTEVRLYDAMLVEYLEKYRQMAFVSGPRQVGKTTTCRNHADAYTNWDNIDDREQILAGPARLVEQFKLNRLSDTTPVVWGSLSRCAADASLFSTLATVGKA